MSEDITTLFTESPASWNTRYVTEDGFTCQLTLRAENGKDLLERANSALSYLRNQGCIPFFGYSRGNSHQVNNKGKSNSEYWCPIHNVEMKRWEKNGFSWLRHLIDGEWCYGKQGENNDSSN